METLLDEAVGLLDEIMSSYNVAGDAPDRLHRYNEHVADLKLRVQAQKPWVRACDLPPQTGDELIVADSKVRWGELFGRKPTINPEVEMM